MKNDSKVRHDEVVFKAAQKRKLKTQVLKQNENTSF